MQGVGGETEPISTRAHHHKDAVTPTRVHTAIYPYMHHTHSYPSTGLRHPDPFLLALPQGICRNYSGSSGCPQGSSVIQGTEYGSRDQGRSSTWGDKCALLSPPLGAGLHACAHGTVTLIACICVCERVSWLNTHHLCMCLHVGGRMLGQGLRQSPGALR